jgi:hypothetical protein
MYALPTIASTDAFSPKNTPTKSPNAKPMRIWVEREIPFLFLDHLRISCSQKGQNGESSIKTEWTSGISYGYRV